MGTIIPHEGIHRFRSLKNDATEDAAGIELRFFCCGERVRFTRHGDPNVIGATVIGHTCPPRRAISFDGDPRPRNADGLVTPRQLSAINGICRAYRMNPQTECRAVFGLEPDRLSRRAASAFIGWLKAAAIERRAVRLKARADSAPCSVES